MRIDVRSALQVAREAFGITAATGELLAGGASANWSAVIHGSCAESPKWVLRCCLRDPRPERIGFLAEFAQAAHRAGLPVPVPRRASDRRWWALDEDGRPWVLLPFMPGRPVADAAVTEEAAWSAGAVLAGFHALEVPPDAAARPGTDSVWAAWVDDPHTAWQSAELACGEDSGLLEPYRPFLDELHRASGALRDLPGPAWTHGDFHGHNLLTRNGAVVSAVLDLDAVALRPVAFDVATAVLMLARTGSGDYRLQPRLAQAVLRGYEEAAGPLAPAEHAALWPAMVLSQLPDPGHLAALRRRGLPLRPALVRPLAALHALREQRPLPTVPRPRQEQRARLVLVCEGARAAATGPAAFLGRLAAAARPWWSAAPSGADPGDVWTVHAGPGSLGESWPVVASRSGARVRCDGRARELRLSPAPGTDDVLVPAVRLLRALLRRQLLAAGEVFLDAAVLELAGRGIALVGGSCSGKTSTLISALSRHPSRLVANDDASVRLGPSGVRACGYPRAVEVRWESLAHLGRAAGPLQAAGSGRGPHEPLYMPAADFAAALGVPTMAAVQLEALVLLAPAPDGPVLRRLGPDVSARRLQSLLAPADPYETWLETHLPAPSPPADAAARLAAALPVWELAQPMTALAESVDLLAAHDLRGPR
ncbi:phosphotransferase [Kitasatospora purpeofusca]|uniref:phosphotransferase n=1 Tax=Kitasatospora purpeofusca TaxID=67352 RepID=UPI002E0E5571|nr:phosphotransferase [Kitasatospora purpeofusca]